MTVYYARYGEKAAERIKELLAEMETAYPAEARKWTDIMDRWRALQDLEINRGVVPEGLPDTNELCIVALGYKLNSDGTMKNHLKSRLKMVVKCARKYPNALVVCSGGGTASKNKKATEAGEMAAYLKDKGIRKSRIITEKGSHTTAQNARNTLDILLRDHPEVKYILIVSGDYHVRAGTLFFEAEAILRAEPGETPPIAVIANAGCKTSTEEISLRSQAGGLIELAGNSNVAIQLYHDKYNMKQWPALP